MGVFLNICLSICVDYFVFLLYDFCVRKPHKVNSYSKLK